MNLVQRQIFGNKAAVQAPNTFIGGVASTINTPALLATKLAIDVSRITNFSIVGNDIKCRITGSYGIPLFAFSSQGTPSTYYNDIDSLVSSLGVECFSTSNIAGVIEFKNCLTIGTYAFYQTPLITEILLTKVTNIGNNAFDMMVGIKKIDIRSCTNLGGTVGDNNVFINSNNSSRIYVHPSLATCNAGAPDGDLVTARNQGKSVYYPTNLTNPLTPTLSNIGNIYNTSIQLIGDINSVNAIDYYEVSVNAGTVYEVKSLGYIVDLTPLTLYNITLKAIDVFGNKSQTSDLLNVTTVNSSFDITTNLQSYYNFNETELSFAYDAFKNKTLTNSGITINQTGKINNSYLSTANIGKLSATGISPITGAFSINVWCYRTANSSSGNCGVVQQGGYGAGFGIWINPSNQIGWFINSNYNNYSSLVVLPLNTWSMITLTYSGTQVKIYQDSVLKVTTACTTNPSSTTTRSLFNREDNNEAYRGKLDLCAFYNASINQGQVDLLYNSGNGIEL